MSSTPPSSLPTDAPGAAVPIEEATEATTTESAVQDAAVPVAALPEKAKPPGMSPAACAAELRQRWPALFAGAPKALKLRTHVDIEARAPGVFTKPVLTAFFRRYTGSTSYLLAVARGRQRFDLDGKPAGEISDEHRQIAIDELTRRGVGLQSRREIEEQQRHNRAGLLFDYERTTLTRANFCALKQVPEAELDGLLEIARAEAAQFQQQHRQQQPQRRPQDARAPGQAPAPGPRRERPPQGARGRGPRQDEGRRR